MSLPDELWQALHLDPAVVADRASFLAAYAELDEPWPNVRDLIRLAAGGQQPSGSKPVVDLLDDNDDEARAFRARVESLGRGEPLAPWARTGELANAWRECGVARLMTDSVEGREALIRAAHLYQELGLPFGSFLLTAVTGSPEPTRVAARQLRALVADQPRHTAPGENLPRYPVPDEGLIDWQYVSGAPTQQISILLTAASDPEVVEQNEQLISALRDAPQASGITPVGTTAQPIALWWAAGLGLADLSRGEYHARADVLGEITELAQAHGRQLRYAQLDSYHWPRAQADVDLADLHLAGLVALTDRALRNSQLGAWSEEEFQAIQPPLSRVSLTLGLELSRYH